MPADAPAAVVRSARGTPPGSTRRLPRRPSPLVRHRGTPWLFLAPALVLYGLFLFVPLVRSVQFSFFDWDGLSATSTFVGLANYADVVADPRLRAAFGHALVLVGFFAVIPLLIGLPLAAVLDRARVRGLSMFRAIVFVPQVLAMVVVAVAWRQIYAPDGPLNGALRAIGLEQLTRAWLGDYTWTLPAVGVVGTWVQTGLVTVLLLAGMARVPREQYEAARLDGAGAFRELVSITVPAVRGEIAVALTLTIIASLKTFDLVYVTTGGGPGTSTTVPAFEVFQRAFRQGDVGSATAIAVVLTLVILALNVAVNRLVGDGGRDAR
ncbi:binding-protein-dependent transport systems inner membrane component [Beutenbergia cavernae DSM 12333]|uniref:Binding-protein-dependent transport systems inner membrane component n=1 Tax=Beutenbergia cavernae (strain ATCC BAA-8 / DSM 12333 / CCUG 43141 / JCM 11478 / NBRC 16432 / NCIMB 13614 / HKI 0122) TaxID=471853 RepID=C5BXF3_BEUC1|nr:sugar ABC transporter permease [Beutenbergia cavernae]ACQ80836.1 binding-protein-dependent transport systems inner membrane component [Beutenbergia cavernae DSM 12333]